jgi:hypothetical protein
MKAGFLKIGETSVNMAAVSWLRFVEAVGYPIASGRPGDPARYEIGVDGVMLTTKEPAEITAINEWLNG